MRWRTTSVPLPAVRAILADNLQDSDAIQTVIQREFLQRTVIPAYSYFTTRGFPETDCETLGVRLLLVARKDVPALSVQPLMRTVFEGQFARRIQPQSPREFATPYAIHPAALAFLDREKPLAIAETIDWFSKGLSIFGAFMQEPSRFTVCYGGKRLVNRRTITPNYANWTSSARHQC